MLVGNDVVDLTEREIASKHENARFVARVCHAAERAALGSAPDPKRLFWAFFAAKEAAYKLVAKLGPPPPFAHRAFVVSTDLASVCYRDLALTLSVEQSAQYVHAVASTRREPVISGVEAIDSAVDESAAARRRLCAAVASVLDWSLEELEVVRDQMPGSWDGFGPPALLRRGVRVEGVDVSISHDGRFVAYAAFMAGQTSDHAGPSAATA